MLSFSKDGLNVLKILEGLRLETYLCKAGVPTIGYGHVIQPGDKHKITELEAALLLKQDVFRFASHVWRVCTEGGRVPEQHQFDAMICLAFNIGEEGFSRSSVLRRFINNDDAGAASAFLLWNKIGREDPITGERILRPSSTLDARRTAESRMFLLGYYDQTPYNPLNDKGEIAELRLSRNRAKGDQNVSAGESEIRPTLKTSRTMKQTTVGGAGATVTGVTATAAVVSTIAEQVTQSAESVRDAVDASGQAVEVVTDTAIMATGLPLIFYGVIIVGAAISLISFIFVRRARKDDWNRGKR